MKKNWKFFAYAVSAAVALTMTACAAAEDTKDFSIVKEETEAENPSSIGEKTQEMEVAASPSGKKETQDTEAVNPSSAGEEILNTETEDDLIFENPILLEDYYNTPDGKAAIEADFADLAGEGMTVEISVIMDSIYVTVKYEDSSLLTEGIEETLAQKLESMTDRFWKWTIAYDENITWRCVLTVRYIDPDGNVLAEQSYSAE